MGLSRIHRAVVNLCVYQGFLTIFPEEEMKMSSRKGTHVMGSAACYGVVCSISCTGNIGVPGGTSLYTSFRGPSSACSTTDPSYTLVMVLKGVGTVWKHLRRKSIQNTTEGKSRFPARMDGKQAHLHGAKLWIWGIWVFELCLLFCVFHEAVLHRNDGNGQPQSVLSGILRRTVGEPLVVS
jgi:hypothetical protein